MGICNIKHWEIDRDNSCIFLFLFEMVQRAHVKLECPNWYIYISVGRIILIPSCLKNASLACCSAWFCLDWKVWRNGGVGLRSWGWQRWKREIFRSWKFLRTFVHQRIVFLSICRKVVQTKLEMWKVRRFCGGDCYGQAALQEFNAESTRPDRSKSIEVHGQFREWHGKVCFGCFCSECFSKWP